MSRSRRKNPFIGNCGGSDKWGKTHANRKLRRAEREAVERMATDCDVILPALNEVSDPWDFSKDGKQYIGAMEPKERNKWMRK